MSRWTPEEEHTIRMAGAGWCSEELFSQIWDELDATRQRIATLEAELAASREDAKLAWAEAAMGPTEAAITHELAQSQAHGRALRDALERLRDRWEVGSAPWTIANEALAQTPVASLAAHDAEVLERAAEIAEEHARPELTMSGKTVYGNPSALKIAQAIRALAAQEVKP